MGRHFMTTLMIGNLDNPRAGQGWARIFILLLAINFGVSLPVGAASVAEQITALKNEKADAIFQVQHIVNQPVTRLKRTPAMNVAMFSPGWFHEGATEPNYDTVDIRTTQENPYAGRKYVTSDRNPGFVFLGDELEFNANTKFFFTDRSLPKKRLTEAEMVEINTLYRTIGRCNRELEDLQNPPPPWTKAHAWVTAHKPVVVAVVAVLVILLFWIHKRTAAAADFDTI